MSTALDALVVRAAGLSTHLLDPPGRAALLRCGDLPHLARELSRLGYATAETRPEAADLELAIRRGAGARLRQLARWGPSAALGPLLFALEDLRSLRALVRGAAAAQPAEVRLAGLLPTPTLPERAQAELARAPAVGAVAALLATWRSPWAPALRPARAGEPDLLQLDVALARLAAGVALRAARDLGASWLRFVQEGIDLDNLRTARILAGRPHDLAPVALFLPGGRALPEPAFRRLATTEPDDLTRVLGKVLAGTPLAALLPPGPAQALTFERDVDELRRRQWRRAARREPLGAAPVVSYLLELRAEVSLLQHTVWGVALGAPPSRRRAVREGAG